MANLNSDFKKILENLENNIQDKDALEAARVEMFNLYNIFFDAYTELEEVANSRIAELAQVQLDTVEELKTIKKSLKNIEKDIYIEDEEDGDFDIEIKCPYCNKTFVSNMDDVSGEEIVCPECNNTIELDWGHDCDCDDECDDDCDCCSHGEHHHCHCEDEDDDM